MKKFLIGALKVILAIFTTLAGTIIACVVLFKLTLGFYTVLVGYSNNLKNLLLSMNTSYLKLKMMYMEFILLQPLEHLPTIMKWYR